MNQPNEFNRKKNLLKKRENIFSLLIIIIIFLLDRFSKNKIINNFSENVYYFNDYLNLNLIWNTGIGFGLFSSNSLIIYNIVTTLVCLVILILTYIAINSVNLEKIIYSIIIGGAFGNVYDRLIYAAVPDFIDLHYKNFHWFTFNVADIFITFGIIAFLLIGFSVDKNK
jgi:signal peptidase II|tara:strand:+ start:150 stop:656 length:507 start_codon:yes stop_codon:yes gene_type:complete